MSMTVKSPLNRRHFLMGAAACVGAPAMAQDLNSASTIEMEQDISSKVRRNVSAFRSLDWQPYFSNLNNGAVLVDIDSRALHFWTEAGEYFLFPSSVPMSEELTRRGRTSVVRKVEGPEWRPTPSMLERNPDWPSYVGPGPDNRLAPMRSISAGPITGSTAPMTRARSGGGRRTAVSGFTTSISHSSTG